MALIEIITAHPPILEAILAGTTPWSRDRLALRATCRAAARAITPPAQRLIRSQPNPLVYEIARAAARVCDADLIACALARVAQYSHYMSIARYYKHVARGFYDTAPTHAIAHARMRAIEERAVHPNHRLLYLLGALSVAVENGDIEYCDHWRVLCGRDHVRSAYLRIISASVRVGNRAMCDRSRAAIELIEHADGDITIFTRHMLCRAARRGRREFIALALEWGATLDDVCSAIAWYGTGDMIGEVTSRDPALVTQLLWYISDTCSPNANSTLDAVAAWYREVARADRATARNLDYIALYVAACAQCRDDIRAFAEEHGANEMDAQTHRAVMGGMPYA